jgi:hypothetical protein
VSGKPVAVEEAEDSAMPAFPIPALVENRVRDGDALAALVVCVEAEQLFVESIGTEQAATEEGHAIQEGHGGPVPRRVLLAGQRHRRRG